MKYKYIFGPVPSRRLGVSLGVDIIPFKTCTFDCIYCECGKTTVKTDIRKEYLNKHEIISEIDHYLKHNPFPEIITLSGSGEPMLNTGMGDIISFIKNNYPDLKVGLITNSSVFVNKETINEAVNADIILPSLDSAIQASFEIINRPYHDIDINDIIEGLISLRHLFPGKIWLEIFILPGINDDTENIEALKNAIKRIRPDRVQLNTLDRPGVEDNLKPADKSLLEKIRSQMDFPSIEIISKYKSRKEISSFRQDMEDAILATVKRRPCTVDDLSEILGLNILELNKYLDVLIKDKLLIAETEERGIFLRAL